MSTRQDLTHNTKAEIRRITKGNKTWSINIPLRFKTYLKDSDYLYSYIDIKKQASVRADYSGEGKRMIVSSGQDINEKIFEKLNQLEIKKKGKQVEKLYPEVIKRSFPDKQILNENQAITHLKRTTNLDEVVIRQCLAELIEKNDLIPSKDSRGQLHLAKMRKMY